MIRLDKFLSDLSAGTRSEVKQYIRKGRVCVNGEVTQTPDYKVIPEKDHVTLDGIEFEYQQYEYYLLNKPAGVISASKDEKDRTVLDLIDSKRKDLFPVGRLDKDTEGLLLITNDGMLAHTLLSPKKGVDKTYFVKVNGRLTSEDQIKMEEGLLVDAELTALPAKLEIIKTGSIEHPVSEAYITIQEGKFHQVKRMFLALGKEVIYLKRIAMGNMRLPDDLELGDYLVLSKDEIEKMLMN